MGEIITRVLEKVIRTKNDVVAKREQEIKLSERTDCMFRTVACLMELTNDRNKISDLLVKHYNMDKGDALHFLADYDIKTLERENQRDG